MRQISSLPELVNAARTGSAPAWNALYRQYYSGLYAVALHTCGNVPAAKDAVQEAFTIAYLKLPQLKEAATFGSWIKKILIHHCYRDLQSTRLTTRLDSIGLESDGWWEDELDRKFDQLATQSRLYAALAGLPEVLRSALLLRYFSNFQSYEQMAAILSIPVGTIRSRLNQAKVKLTQQWQQHTDAGLKIVEECEDWNSFYKATYSGLHHQDSAKNQFINHLQKDIQIKLASNRTVTGNWFFERKVDEDLKVGSWLKADQVTSCGNISVIEASHYNSPEHPHHCPAHSVAVLYRQKGKVDKMHLYVSPQ
jgi:RNA polymerase sigma-70 factor (ECF subfamily)